MAEVKGDFCRIHLRVRCETRRGQFLAVTGSAPALRNYGGDFPAVRLVTCPNAYPVWHTATPLLVPRSDFLTYKYCIVEDGEIRQYESRASPRMLLPEDEDIVIEDCDIDEHSWAPSGNAAVDKGADTSARFNDSEKLERVKELGQRNGRLFLVCYHLPVVIRRTNCADEPFEISWSESLIAKTRGSVADSVKTIWIGTVSLPGELNAGEKEYLIVLLRQMDCIPVFLDQQDASDAYYGYCKEVMWPIFHNVDQLDHIHAAWNLQLEDSRPLSGIGAATGAAATSPTASLTTENKVLEWNQQEVRFYSAYEKVNNVFAEQLHGLVREGDVVWVHDYHLMLVPRHLRLFEIPNVKIIFFLHIPFPTSQIFRTLPEATVLLQSMLCADLIGFHAFDHARHFLNAARRMLGVTSASRPGGVLILTVAEREVIVTMSHVGVECDRLDAVLADPETHRMAQALQERYKGKRLVLGIDVCQRLSGIALKLSAFDKFCSDMGGGSGNQAVVLLQRGIRQGSRPQDEETTSNDVKKLVGELNARYGAVVDYAEVNSFKGIPLQERIALYLAADVFLLTPIREGLNLMPLEYIYARKDQIQAGCVVVSEFSTCASLLNGALKVNPFSASSVAEAMEKGLNMPRKDGEYRRQRDLQFIGSHPSSLWTKQTLNEVEALQQRSRNQKQIQRLSPALLRSAYDAAEREMKLSPAGTRVFILDYGGVLVPKEQFDIHIKQSLSAIAGRRPTDEMMEMLRQLTEDDRNVVLLLTGLTRTKLGDTFKALPNLSIATSNGLVYSWGKNLLEHEHYEEAVEDRHWECIPCDIDWQAVADIAVPIITKFTFRTNGTCQTPRFPGIGWSYFGADPEWGAKQANQLRCELEAALAHHDVKVTSLISGSIEVVPKSLQKGQIVRLLLDKLLEMRAGRLPGLICVMSGEEADEGMAHTVFDVAARCGREAELRRAKLFAASVGKRDSCAQYYVHDVKEVEKIFEALLTN